jgi:serine/threonine protein phosphatase 1
MCGFFRARGGDGGEDRLFCIGDVHGCADELEALIAKLPLNADSTVVFLGDYIDRGPRTSQVVELVLTLSTTCRVVPLIGNHEELFLGFLENPASDQGMSFIYNGGGATLASYAGANAKYDVPERHMAFFRNLQLFYETPDFFFVHAGVPDLPLSELTPENRRDLLWLRDSFLESDYRWSKVIIHGHTRVDEVTIRPNRINLDTGCVANNALSAIGLPSRQLYSVRRAAQQELVLLRDPISRREAVRFVGKAPVFLQTGLCVAGLETVDFNELGFYARETGVGDDVNVKRGDSVGGHIQLLGGVAVRFSGVVVRRDVNTRGRFLAVRFDRPTLADGA